MDAISTGERLFGERAPGRLASVSGGPPRLAQRLPANQRAPEREERLVDVGPPVVPDAQAAKLTEPGEGAFHDPSPPAQTTPMLCAAHGQQGHDVTRPQTAPNGSRVLAAIPEHTTEQRRQRPALRHAFLRAHHHSVGHHHLGCQHPVDEREEPPILDLRLQPRHQSLMVDTVEEFLEARSTTHSYPFSRYVFASAMAV